ncbi:hypothetical protein Tco_1013371 [Tanacetum coccineum]
MGSFRQKKFDGSTEFRLRKALCRLKVLLWLRLVYLVENFGYYSNSETGINDLEANMWHCMNEYVKEGALKLWWANTMGYNHDGVASRISLRSLNPKENLGLIDEFYVFERSRPRPKGQKRLGMITSILSILSLSGVEVAVLTSDMDSWTCSSVNKKNVIETSRVAFSLMARSKEYQSASCGLDAKWVAVLFHKRFLMTKVFKAILLRGREFEQGCLVEFETRAGTFDSSRSKGLQCRGIICFRLQPIEDGEWRRTRGFSGALQQHNWSVLARCNNRVVPPYGSLLSYIRML